MATDQQRVRDLLSIAAAIADSSSHLWDLAIDPRSQNGVETLYGIIVSKENAAQRLDADGLVRVARAFREDLLGLAADPRRTLREPSRPPGRLGGRKRA
jgi:hypothetical protein